MLMYFFRCTQSSRKTFRDEGTCTIFFLSSPYWHSSPLGTPHTAVSLGGMSVAADSTQAFLSLFLMMPFFPHSPAMLKIQLSGARLVIVTLCIASTSADRVDSLSTEWIHFTRLRVCASELVHASNSHCRERHGDSQASTSGWGETLLLELLPEGI